MRRLLDHLIIAILYLASIHPVFAQWPQFGGPTRNFQARNSQIQHAISNPSHCPTVRWQQTLGDGMAGIVVQDEVVFTTFLKPFNAESKSKPESEREHREVVIALNAESGETIWRYEYDAGWIESQQAFGGRCRAPQATPVVCGDYLVTIGFTGSIHCLKKDTGELVWQKDSMKEYDAIPVQFGFAASPITDGDRLFVLTGGKKGGLVCLDTKTGEMIWNVATKEASYATPVLWNREDRRQIIATTRNRVFAVDAANGKQLWEYKLPGKELTNVPTPMSLGASKLLISGQGIQGTCLLAIEATPAGFEVTEKWKSDAQFFYCNWVQHDDYLFGCDGSLLVTLDLRTGKTVGRFRGFNDANLLLLRENMLILHGDGHLSTFHLNDREMRAIGKFQILNERCWVPPTPHHNLLYCR
ncbi:MAG: PQQ-like beta-propeller repeat protein, partial [Planctomycetales bacterium]|nr:PQQ-like beta-propeller repeat protein [Planctomycetales bacterium]